MFLEIIDNDSIGEMFSANSYRVGRRSSSKELKNFKCFEEFFGKFSKLFRNIFWTSLDHLMAQNLKFPIFLDSENSKNRTYFSD